MPKVIVYVRSNDWERLQRDGVDPAAWTRRRVAEALKERPVAATVEPGRNDPGSAPSRCERRHPMIPAERCTLQEGHLGSHSWSDK